MRIRNFLALIAISIISSAYGQEKPSYDGGLKVKLNEDGSKYFRIISWIQGQATYNPEVAEDASNINFNLRRARVLTYAQFSDKFMILTHFGLNNLNGNTMSPLGKSTSSSLFLHDAWAQYNINRNHTVGIGLHYFNGISRLNNASTLNMMTLDNNRESWSTLGLSDQFGRHIGIFAKGNIGKLQYRLAVNDAMVNTLDNRNADNSPAFEGTVYQGKKVLGSKEAGFNYAGYFEYQLLDTESNFLPYKVGTYLGSKEILNIGAGFFYHPNGSVNYKVDGGVQNISGQDVSLLAVDVFYESPLKNNDAITAYLTYQNNNYGEDYMYSAYGTGSMIYSHLGYLFPGEKDAVRFQAYTSFGYNSYDASEDSKNKFGIGGNIYFSGHHSKLSFEYMRESFGEAVKPSITIQAMIFI